MTKLIEKNGAEMCACLVNIAAPLRRFMDDEQFSNAFKKATQNGLKMGLNDVLAIYTDIVPLLFGETHLKDTLAILAEIEGMSVKELMEMNGTDLIADTIKAFTEQLKPFFMRLGISVGDQ